MNLKPKLLPCLGLVLNCILYGGNTGHADELATNSAVKIYQNTNYGFKLAVPRDWTVTETNFEVFHYNEVFLTINSQRPNLTLREQWVSTNTIEYNFDIAFRQLLPGEAYISIGYFDGPGGSEMKPDHAADTLTPLLDANPFRTFLKPKLSELELSFFKRGHHWNIIAYLRQPATADVSNEVMNVLKSFRFEDAPVGNAAWAESLAWEQLPENIRQFNHWPVTDGMGMRPVWGRNTVLIKKADSGYRVHFALTGLGTWEYTVSENGKVEAGTSEVDAPSPSSSEMPSDLPGQSHSVTTITLPADIYSSRINMVNLNDGWLEVEGMNSFQLWRTTDGARIWTDVTPRPFPHKLWDCQFPTANLAWVSYCETNTFLLLTTNAGKSWVPWTPLGSFDNQMHNFFLHTDSCRFFNANDGLAVDLGVGACQAVYNFFETHDGGLSWKPAPLSDGPPLANQPEGMIQIGDCDGSAVEYYPPQTIVKALGDLMDETPKGVVRLSLSTNRGQTWRDLSLPLPGEFRDRLVQSFSPYFFDANNAMLEIALERETTNGFDGRALMFYSSHDGGNTWSAEPEMFSPTNATDAGDCDFVSPRSVFVKIDADLYSTRNGGRSWQKIKSNLGFENTSQLDFVDADHGWMIASGDRDFPADTLFKTSNGGKTWTPLPINISSPSPTAVSER